MGNVSLSTSSMPFVRRRRTYSTGRRQVPIGIPRLPRSISRRVNLEQAAVNTQLKYYSTTINTLANAAVLVPGVDDATEYRGFVSALGWFYANTAQFTNEKTQWAEFRIRQVKLHFMLAGMDDATSAKWTKSDPLQVVYAWQRFQALDNKTGSDGAMISKFDDICKMPNSKQTCWHLNANPQFYTTITAGQQGGEQNWIRTQSAPGVAPNTIACFAPCLNFCISTITPPAQGEGKTVKFIIEADYVIEFRGSLL